MHSFVELGCGYFRKAFGHFPALRRKVINTCPGCPTPALNPAAAETAFAIVNQDGAGGPLRNVTDHFHSEITAHGTSGQEGLNVPFSAILMKIAIGSDHAGFQYKEAIKRQLISRGHAVDDFGCDSDAVLVDYPTFIRPVAEAVKNGTAERGIVLGGSGNGEAITANRVQGIRCTVCWNLESARLARQHNDANVLSLGQRMISLEAALEIVRVWLETPFEGGRHVRRIQLIDEPSLATPGFPAHRVQS